MNTNSNLYTIIYSALIVTLVAAILAFASISLSPRQEANAKAETISQMLAAAHFAEKDALNELSNDEILKKYADNIEAAFTVNAKGEKVADLNIGKDGLQNIELADNLKAENTNIKKFPENLQLPVYIFNKDGKKVTVIPVYGGGLWGPIWGYLAFDEDMSTILGAYFDHDSETPGLGAKIKDDPNFRAEFDGKKIDFNSETLFLIEKGGIAEGETNAVDAITGATMTCKGLDLAINVWLAAYKPYFTAESSVAPASETATESEVAEESETKTAEE